MHRIGKKSIGNAIGFHRLAIEYRKHANAGVLFKVMKYRLGKNLVLRAVNDHRGVRSQWRARNQHKKRNRDDGSDQEPDDPKEPRNNVVSRKFLPGPGVLLQSLIRSEERRVGE